MSTHYNPKISLTNLKLYFDTKNPKSFWNGNVLSSLISSDQLTLTPIIDSDGFITLTKLSDNTTQILDISDNVSFVVSVKPTTNSKGVILSLCDTNNYYYLKSNNYSITANNINTTVLSNTTYNISYNKSNNSLTTANNASTVITGNTTYNIIYNKSNNSLTTANNANTTILSNTTYNITYSNSSLTTAQSNVSITNSAKQELYKDYKKLDFSVYLDNSSLMVRLKDGENLTEVSNAFTKTYNDIFVITVTKNPNAIKIYQNGNLIGEKNNFIFENLANNFSFLNKNVESNLLSVPVRSVLIYNKELTLEEIVQISSALQI